MLSPMNLAINLCAAPMGSTSLRARGPHGAAVLMGSTSLGARPPYALVVLTVLQSSCRPIPLGAWPPCELASAAEFEIYDRFVLKNDVLYTFFIIKN